MKLEIISFALCPFVQRSIITLNYKKAEFKTTFIDLKNKPDWFLKISPLGRVPVLRVNEETSLFESAVINEYLDETIGSPLMPADPLQRALDRAWIQFSSDLYTQHYMMNHEKSSEELESRLTSFFNSLARVEDVVSEGPFFHGSEFSLIDTSWAPLFMRVLLSQKINSDPRWAQTPKVRRWAEELLKVPAVKNSVVPNFSEQYFKYTDELNSLIR